MKKINCIIIDDEELARSALKLLINKLNCQHSSISIEVLSECKNTSQALKIIPKLKPDFIFLDINMPNQSGLEMLSDLPKSQLPLIIFVTAYSEYAIQGFETNAVDYLMKPVSMQRLAESINRVHERMKSWAKDTFIIVKDGSRKLKLQCKNIISIQAAGNYMCIKTFDETLIQ